MNDEMRDLLTELINESETRTQKRREEHRSINRLKTALREVRRILDGSILKNTRTEMALMVIDVALNLDLSMGDDDD